LLPKRNRRGIRGAAGDRVFVDTSAWIALFSRRDQHHRDADSSFRAALARRVSLLTTNLVLAEVHRLLLFRAGPAAAAAALEHIDRSGPVAIGFADATHHAAARDWLHRLKDHRITYTDAVSFSFMAASRCGAALTYKNHFAVAGFDIAPPHPDQA
jgi:predicted nucleic acid-binding protein